MWGVIVVLASQYVTVTQGNLDNHHLYLAKILDFFPEDVLGGSNFGQCARRMVRVHWGNEVVETDID